MKKVSFLGLLFLILVASCGPKPEEQVKEFAIKFGDFVNTNKKDSIQKYYPGFELTDDVNNVAINSIIVAPGADAGAYIIDYLPETSLNVVLEKTGKITVKDSKGLLAFPLDEVETAYRKGIWDNKLNDIQMRERMRKDGLYGNYTSPNKSGSPSSDRNSSTYEYQQEPSHKTLPNVGNDAMSYILSSPAVNKNGILSSPAVNKNGDLIHFFRGYFADTKKQYPIMIAFIEKNDMITSAEYKNINYHALVKMSVRFSSNHITLDGKAGKDNFSIYLTSDNAGKSWRGMAESNTSLDVFLEPTSEQFNF